METSQPEDLAELRHAFVLFRTNVIDEMARIEIEMAAIYRASLEACGRPLDEFRLKNCRLAVLPMRGAFVDEITQRLGLQAER